jgi:hypothetical protein
MDIGKKVSDNMVFFTWLLRTSLMASILIVFILLIKLILRDRLGPKWHYYIWFLVLLRLVIPLDFQSAVSIYNALPSSIPTPIIYSQLDPHVSVIVPPGRKPLPENRNEMQQKILSPMSAGFPRLKPLLKTFLPGLVADAFLHLVNRSFWLF